MQANILHACAISQGTSRKSEAPGWKFESVTGTQHALDVIDIEQPGAQISYTTRQELQDLLRNHFLPQFQRGRRAYSQSQTRPLTLYVAKNNLLATRRRLAQLEPPDSASLEEKKPRTFSSSCRSQGFCGSWKHQARQPWISNWSSSQKWHAGTAHTFCKPLRVAPGMS